MSDTQQKQDPKEIELEIITREIEKLSVRRASIQSEQKEEAKRRERERTRKQRAQQQNSQRARYEQSKPQTRRSVLEEQYSARAINKFVQIKERLIREYGAKSRSRSFRIPLFDARRQELRVGDFVRALTKGRNYTDRGIVSRFSKDRSRVYFLDFRGQEQNQAPDNLAHVDE